MSDGSFPPLKTSASKRRLKLRSSSSSSSSSSSALRPSHNPASHGKEDDKPGVGISKRTQALERQVSTLARSLPRGLVSMILPSSAAVVLTNPRYDSSNKRSFSVPSKDMAVGGAINAQYKPVQRGFSYSFPGMYQDTGIASLEKEANRREMHIRTAKQRLERLEKLKIEAEEKRRVRDALRAKKRKDKARFQFAVTALQSAFRGSKDREVFNQELYVHRQKLRAVKALQSALRGQKGRLVAHERKVVVVGAATKIQRRYSARLHYKQAQIDIENMLQEREIARQKALEEFQNECATQLQAFFRGVRDREVVAAKRRKRKKKLKSLKAREADMKKKLAGMAGKKKKGARSPKRRGMSTKKKR